MFQRLIIRVCFKWSSWILIGFLLFYIYVIALYFLYSNQNRVDKYDYDYELDEHPVHDHLIDSDRQLPEGFKTWAQVTSNMSECAEGTVALNTAKYGTLFSSFWYQILNCNPNPNSVLLKTLVVVVFGCF